MNRAFRSCSDAARLNGVGWITQGEELAAGEKQQRKDNRMFRKLSLAAGLMVMAAALAPNSASAAAAMPQSRLVDVAADAGSLLHQASSRHRHRRHAHYRHRHRHGHVHFRSGRGISYCGAWRAECAGRWGWGTRSFYRCLWRHGC
jgi:hypothetical protein